MDFLKTSELFKGEHSIACDFLRGFEYPWQALSFIKEYVFKLGSCLNGDEYNEIKPGVWVHRHATVAKSAHIDPPTIICQDAQIRHCAYIRGGAIVGTGAIVGNSTELKNCILFDGAAVPHYNYIGDSILGYRAHMGAGSVTSNVKGDKSEVCIMGKIHTGQRKVGAMIGDDGEIGCGAVLNPGTVVGMGARIYPLTSVRGYVPSYHIYKGKGDVAKICVE